MGQAIEAQVARERTNLAYTAIRSPIDGVVIARSVDVGQTVAASFQTPTLFLIARDLRDMQIDTNVAEADVALKKELPGKPYTVKSTRVHHLGWKNESAVERWPQ